MTDARLTSKGKVTVPVKVSKARLDASWHRALTSTLEEWNSPEDNEAFGDL